MLRRSGLIVVYLGAIWSDMWCRFCSHSQRQLEGRLCQDGIEDDVLTTDSTANRPSEQTASAQPTRLPYRVLRL